MHPKAKKVNGNPSETDVCVRQISCISQRDHNTRHPFLLASARCAAQNKWQKIRQTTSPIVSSPRIPRVHSNVADICKVLYACVSR